VEGVNITNVTAVERALASALGRPIADVQVVSITTTLKARRRDLVASKVNFLIKNVAGDAIDAVEQQLADSVEDVSGSGMTAILASNLGISATSMFLAVTQGLARVTTTTTTTAPQNAVVTVTLAGTSWLPTHCLRGGRLRAEHGVAPTYT
jgi:hypothetical protein